MFVIFTFFLLALLLVSAGGRACLSSTLLQASSCPQGTSSPPLWSGTTTSSGDPRHELPCHPVLPHAVATDSVPPGQRRSAPKAKRQIAVVVHSARSSNQGQAGERETVTAAPPEGGDLLMHSVGQSRKHMEDNLERIVGAYSSSSVSSSPGGKSSTVSFAEANHVISFHEGDKPSDLHALHQVTPQQMKPPHETPRGTPRVALALSCEASCE